MGWWDAGILGGDTPYDVCSVLSDVLQLGGFEDFDEVRPESWSDEEAMIVRGHVDNLAGGCDKLLEEVVKQSLGDVDGAGFSDPNMGHVKDEYVKEHTRVAKQVTGLWMISAGVPISEAFRTAVIEACEDEVREILEHQEGTTSRTEVLQQFMETMRTYDALSADRVACRVSIPQKGLFDHMDEATGCLAETPAPSLPRFHVTASWDGSSGDDAIVEAASIEEARLAHLQKLGPDITSKLDFVLRAWPLTVWEVIRTLTPYETSQERCRTTARFETDSRDVLAIAATAVLAIEKAQDGESEMTFDEALELVKHDNGDDALLSDETGEYLTLEEAKLNGLEFDPDCNCEGDVNYRVNVFVPGKRRMVMVRVGFYVVDDRPPELLEMHFGQAIEEALRESEATENLSDISCDIAY